jgi:uncharacterized protein YbjT (DUF2867 family)
MATAAIFGCTGAIGSNLLATTIAQDAYTSIKTISRRLPKQESAKLDATLETDTSKWAPAIAGLTPPPSVVFNALGTTRAEAGGLQNQWKIDHDLCIELAQAAKAAGVKTFVYISSAGTRGLLSRYVPYSKMKIGVEDAIKELDFEQAIIMRPGMILERETPKAPFFENLVSNLHKISPAFQDSLGKLPLTWIKPRHLTHILYRSRSEDHRESYRRCGKARE